MRSMRTQWPFRLRVGLVSGVALWLSGSAWGQTAPAGATPAAKPAVTAQRQGRLLVLSYKLVSADGRPAMPSVPSSRPEFTVHKGKRKIASGKFEYG